MLALELHPTVGQIQEYIFHRINLSAIGADTTRAKLFFELFDADFTREINAICGDGEAEMIGEEREFPDDDE